MAIIHVLFLLNRMVCSSLEEMTTVKPFPHSLYVCLLFMYDAYCHTYKDKGRGVRDIPSEGEILHLPDKVSESVYYASSDTPTPSHPQQMKSIAKV